MQACNPSTWEAETQELYFEGQPEQLNEETPEFSRGMGSGAGWWLKCSVLAQHALGPGFHPQYQKKKEKPSFTNSLKL